MAAYFWLALVSSVVLVLAIESALERAAKQQQPGWSMKLVGFCIFILFWCAVGVVRLLIK